MNGHENYYTQFFFEKSPNKINTAVVSRGVKSYHAWGQIFILDIARWIRTSMRFLLKQTERKVKDKDLTPIFPTTFLKSLNRLTDLILGASHAGAIFLDGMNIYDPKVDLTHLRRRIGMVFDLPTPLPMSIFDNVAYGPKVNKIFHKRRLAEVVEKALRSAVLWEEVKDRLYTSALRLSGGQQQRLCIARILALEPEVLLLDEPCSGLDPISTPSIEETLIQLKKDYTIILVPHNVQQASRVADRAGFFLNGELVEEGPAYQIFTKPKDKRTEDYVTGRFG